MRECVLYDIHVEQGKQKNSPKIENRVSVIK